MTALRSLNVAVFVLVTVTRGAIAVAQEPPPRIPLFAVDLHATIPRFPDDQGLADSRGMQLEELPGTGLGAQLAVNLYPLRWKGITFGIGAEGTANRSRRSAQTFGTTSFRASEEKFLSATPELSFNFGTGTGWSYVSGGIGVSQWSIIPAGQQPLQADAGRRKTINYGGGARWFARPHLAFSFDVRFYAINPSPGELTFASTPRTTLLIIGAGVSLK